MKCLLFLLFFFAPLSFSSTLKVGSKKFTESYILSEIIAQIAEDVGEADDVERHFGLGGTGITYEALKNGAIDIYVDYTGTIAEAILKDASLVSVDDINRKLDNIGLEISPSLGFNNTYALGVSRKFAGKTGIETISDLKKRDDLVIGFNSEFEARKDGFLALKSFYGLKFKDVLLMDKALTLEAFRKGELDVVVVYSTDAKIEKFKVAPLSDDLNFFPVYKGVMLVSGEFKRKFPKTWERLNDILVGGINNYSMMKMNSKVELKGESFAQVAASFLGKTPVSKGKGVISKIIEKTIEHIELVFISLFFAVVVGVPLGVLATRNKYFAQAVLSGSGLLQTIPSLALLCFLIPLLGIGKAPALMALFLYSLLPIVRNTYTGLEEIDAKILESAYLMGLKPIQILLKVRLPLASFSILAGIKTSAIINVGTATLAAFIGAGGLGTLIVTGLSLNNNEIILQGAIPAAVLAMVFHGIFELVDRVVIPKGLRL